MSDKVKLAVFDFDGTIIPSQSGMKLSLDLVKTGQLNKRTAIRLIFWGLRYKAHLPYKERVPRELIFRPFAGKNVDEVNEYIDEFYEEHLDKTVRGRLIEIADELKQDGYEPVILSAAFTSTLNSFSKRHGFLHIVGTEMSIDEDGNYTGKVEGECVAGDEKLRRLYEYADETFGCDNWEIEYAFADHYTDLDLLNEANYVCAVDPDKTLRKYAKKNNWEIIDFEKGEVA